MFPKGYSKLITAAAAGLLLQPFFLQTSFGQNQRGATPPSTGAPSTNTGTPTTTTPNTGRTPSTIPNTTNPNPTTPSMPQPIFLTGRVMIDDGTPLPEPVVIQRVCNGSQHAEGYTDSKGFFGIELGSRNSGVMQDASEFGSTRDFGGIGGMQNQSQSNRNSGFPDSFSDRRTMNCELQAKLAGYRSQMVNLANRRPMDDPNVGTILLHRIGTAEGNTVSALSLAAPKDARKAYDKGMDALKKKKADDAEKDFQKAVELYPKYAAAWHELGKLQQGANNLDAAKQSFNTAIQADPKFMAPYLQLSVMALHDKNWQEVSDITDRIVKLDPFDYPQAFFFNAVANYNLKNAEAAEKSAVQAAKLDTRQALPQVNQLLGILMAQRKDFTGAAAQFKNYLKIAPNGPEADTVRKQLEEVEQFAAATASVKQDQEKENK